MLEYNKNLGQVYRREILIPKLRKRRKKNYKINVEKNLMPGCNNKEVNRIEKTYKELHTSNSLHPMQSSFNNLFP